MTVSKFTLPPKLEEIVSKINEIIDNLGGGGASTLNDLSDVSITSATNGQVLEYNNGNWVNTNHAKVIIRRWS